MKKLPQFTFQKFGLDFFFTQKHGKTGILAVIFLPKDFSHYCIAITFSPKLFCQSFVPKNFWSNKFCQTIFRQRRFPKKFLPAPT